MSSYEIPLLPRPQVLRVDINGTTYTLRTYWVDDDAGGWFLDIGDARGTALICAVPLTPGVDLLAQYAYLGIGSGAQLYCFSDGAAATPIPFSGLGRSGHLVWSV